MSDQDTPLAPLLTAFLAGAVLGAVVVARTTPRTGEQLREDLADFLDGLRKGDAGDPQA